MKSRIETVVKVHPKYMIVLPKAIRTALGIRVGDTLDVKLIKRKAEITPLRMTSLEAVRKTYGMFRIPRNVDVDTVIERAELLLAEDLEGGKRWRKVLR
jgi:AbrB family looped-hinge helix DNA binding protein